MKVVYIPIVAAFIALLLVRLYVNRYEEFIVNRIPLPPRPSNEQMKQAAQQAAQYALNRTKQAAEMCAKQHKFNVSKLKQCLKDEMESERKVQMCNGYNRAKKMMEDQERSFNASNLSGVKRALAEEGLKRAKSRIPPAPPGCT